MSYESELYLARAEKEESIDINEEYVLPEYLPEIKRILVCRALAMPPEVSFGQGTLLADGKVEYKVVYSANDGKLYCASLEGEYDFAFSLPYAGGNGEEQTIVNVYAENPSVRLQSQRRITLKGRVLASAVFQSPADDDECMRMSRVPSECEALCKNVPGSEITVTEKEIFELADEVINDMQYNNMRIILCESCPMVTDIDVKADGITVRGEVDTSILVCDDEISEVPRLLRRKTPFSFMLSNTEQGENREYMCANVVCIASNAVPENETILLNITCAVSVISVVKTEVKICNDIYSPSNEITVSERSVNTYTPVVCVNKNMSVNAALMATEAELEKDKKLVLSFATVMCDKAPRVEENGRESVCGNVVFELVMVDDSSKTYEYEKKEVSVPFKYELVRDVSSSAQGEQILLANAVPTRTFSRFDGDRVGLDTELALTITLLRKNKNQGVSEIAFGEKIKRNDECVKIVYPNSGESLWNVAKRTHSRLACLKRKNGIEDDCDDCSADALSRKRYLIL